MNTDGTIDRWKSFGKYCHHETDSFSCWTNRMPTSDVDPLVPGFQQGDATGLWRWGLSQNL